MLRFVQMVLIFTLLGGTARASDGDLIPHNTRLKTGVAFTILAPKNAKSHPCTKTRCAFSNWNDSIYLSISVRAIDKSEFSAAQQHATTRNLKLHKRVESGAKSLLLVFVPQGGLFKSQVVEYFVQHAGGYLKTTCTAAPKLESMLMRICQSLKLLRNSTPSR